MFSVQLHHIIPNNYRARINQLTCTESVPLHALLALHCACEFHRTTTHTQNPNNQKEQQQKKPKRNLRLECGLYLEEQKRSTCARVPANTSVKARTHLHSIAFYFQWVAEKVISLALPSSSSPLLSILTPLSHQAGSTYSTSQREENRERKGIMTVRREKRGSERKEGQTGYYEREGWEQWRHLESLFAFLSLGLFSQSDWSIRPAM